MKFKTTLLMITALVFCAGLSRYVMACPGITLPAASMGNTMSFGVALVYSLPMLGVNAPSSPSQISDCIVVTTDPNGVLIGVNSAVMNDLYGSRGSSDSRTGGSPSSTDDELKGDAAITWSTMMSALQAFLASRPGLANFNLPAGPTKKNTEPQNGGVASDAAPAGGDPVASAGDLAPAGGDAVPAGGDSAPAASPILPAASAVVSPELNTLLDPNFDVAVVPEPGTLVLFGMGLLVLGLWRVKRRRH